MTTDQGQDPTFSQQGQGQTGGTQGQPQGQQGSSSAHTPFSTTITLPAHQLVIDEQRFLRMLAGSLSLSLAEKKRIVESIPKLSQYQVDKLLEILDEEVIKFQELEEKYADQVQKLRQKQEADWQMLEMEVQKTTKAQLDQQKADEIRKKLGL